WSSMWIPVRMALGIALMIPKASGYSIIQIFVMWIVVQGVGAADTLWNATVRYIQGAGTATPQVLSAAQVQPIADLAIKALRAQVCLRGYNTLYNKANPKEIPLSFAPSYPALNKAKDTNLI